MELEVFWSQFAQDKLQDIFDYYKSNGGIKVARKMVDKIVDATIHLDKNPRMGPIEQLLRDRTQEFRYLISTNYKIIYYINFKTRRVVIANIFDTRQNPDNMINEIETK